jgi:hypothetical protein
MCAALGIISRTGKKWRKAAMKKRRKEEREGGRKKQLYKLYTNNKK